MTAETIIQSLASGLLMGLLYGLIAVGLALIFGLMDVVNFAHGEFLMIAMYATFFLFAFFAIDPLLAAPLVAAALFVFGALVYLLVVRFAVRAKANAGMVQIFSTFGLAIVMRGLAQFFFTPDYRSITHSLLGGRTISISGIFLPVPQLAGAGVSIAAFAALYFFINRTDFGRALEATREDAGAVVYLLIVRFAVRAKANAGMVQIFSTFGLAIVMRGLAQYFFTPDYRSITHSWLGGRTISMAGIFLPVPQLAGALISILAFGALYFFINRTDFGRALEATREDAGAVALVGIDKNRVFALGWGLGAALVGLAGAIMAMFFYVYPDVGASFALIAYVTVALGGFGSVFGAFAGGIIVGLVEASTALILPPSLKSVGIYAVYLLVVFIRPRGLFGSI